jgi:hypothetical protein
MFESAAPQNNSNLRLEKGLACDVRHRFAFSAVYSLPSLRKSGLVNTITKDWRLSAIYQAQSGFPFTVSVFGDTANAGTILGENPIRANVTGQPIFPHGTRNFRQWMNPAAFTAPPAYTFGNAGRNSVYGPPMRMMDNSAQRSISLRKETPLIVQADFFNALNHTSLGTPNRFVNEPQFGSITMPMMPGREIQLSARYQF